MASKVFLILFLVFYIREIDKYVQYDKENTGRKSRLGKNIKCRLELDLLLFHFNEEFEQEHLQNKS